MEAMSNSVWHQGMGRRGFSAKGPHRTPDFRADWEGFAEATGLAIVMADYRGRITSWNTAAEKMFGITRHNALGKLLEIIIPERFRAAHRLGIENVAAGNSSPLLGRTVEVLALRADGSEFPIELSLASWKSRNGVEFGAHIKDIADRRTAEAKLEHRASHDNLTGLPSSEFFLDQVNCVIEKGDRTALLMIDLDGFKAVNDSLGHSVGDALLQSLTVRLRAVAEPSWIIGRMGGDEFAVAVQTDKPAQEVVRSAEKVLHSLSKAFRVEGHRLHISASIGIAISPGDASDGEELLVLADRAMFEAKRSGGRKVQLFNSKMRAELEERRALNKGLRDARAENQWELLYQPQFDLVTGKLVGAEALLRWRHPEWGLIEPVSFLPVLDNHLAAFDVGQWVLMETCRQLTAWRDAEIDIPRISCNLFAAQLHAQSFRNDVFKALRSNGLKPQDIELEITEKIALKLDRASLRPLFELVESGLGLALDDFGTGFASLTTLTKAPITQLKIDRSFVDRITTDPHSSAVVAGMVAMSEELRVGLIAEGVENQGQVRRLRELGCDTMQGYLFGKPMSGSEFATFVCNPSAARSL